MNEHNLPAVISNPDSDKITDQQITMLQLFAQEVAKQMSAYKGSKSVTLKELYDKYMELHAKQRCKRRNMERIYDSYLKEWADRQVSSITRMEIEELMAERADNTGKTTANRVVQMLRPMFNKGIEWDPCTNISVYRLKPRERFLEQEELQRLFAAFDRLRYETTRDFLYICLFTVSGAEMLLLCAGKMSALSALIGFFLIPKMVNLKMLH